jgi:hypothetical protein
MLASLFNSSTGNLPKTKVFFGNFYESTSFGGISLDAEKDSSQAKIIFYDKDRHKKLANLRVFELKKLKKMPLFQSSSEDAKPEKLISTWTTHRNANTIFKVAGDEQLALTFTSNDVQNDFQKLFTLDLRMIDYFNELNFCTFLKNNLNLSIDQLRLITGMNEYRIRYLLKHYGDFQSLILQGFTIEQLGIISQPQLDLLLNNSYQLDKIFKHGVTPSQLVTVNYDLLNKFFNQFTYIDNTLKFITIQQILGLNSKPLPLAEIKIDNYFHGKIVGYISSSNSELAGYLTTCESSMNKQTVKIQHAKSPGVFEATSIKLKDDLKDFEQMRQQTSPIKLIHEWHVLKSAANERLIYCPDLRILLLENHQLKVPQNILDFGMIDFVFYKEKKFTDFLTLKGCPIDRFRNLPGMSERKLKLLFENHYTMDRLLNTGINIEELADIHELRLENVLLNFNKIEDALKFVTMKQILDLPEVEKELVLEVKPSLRMK